ncbi:MAG: nucleotidyltransferase domain-containing protein [Clostridiales bacterium]|jgi:predicted nucleotidyltransferase|nr:nucleotidyltransferase domain-containing protein [Clostridiales bacterium]
MLRFTDIQSGVAQVARLYEIKRVSLFGSYASGEQTEDSDIDLLVEFEEPSVSLFKLAGIKIKLQELTGKTVDVIHSPIPPDSLIEIGKEVLVYEQ